MADHQWDARLTVLCVVRSVGFGCDLKPTSRLGTAWPPRVDTAADISHAAEAGDVYIMEIWTALWQMAGLGILTARREFAQNERHWSRKGRAAARDALVEKHLWEGTIGLHVSWAGAFDRPAIVTKRCSGTVWSFCRLFELTALTSTPWALHLCDTASTRKLLPLLPNGEGWIVTKVGLREDVFDPVSRPSRAFDAEPLLWAACLTSKRELHLTGSFFEKFRWCVGRLQFPSVSAQLTRTNGRRSNSDPSLLAHQHRSLNLNLLFSFSSPPGNSLSLSFVSFSISPRDPFRSFQNLSRLLQFLVFLFYFPVRRGHICAHQGTRASIPTWISTMRRFMT